MQRALRTSETRRFEISMLASKQHECFIFRPLISLPVEQSGFIESASLRSLDFCDFCFCSHDSMLMFKIRRHRGHLLLALRLKGDDR